MQSDNADTPALDRLARRLLRARQEASSLAPPSSEDPEFSLADGYAVGRMLHERLMEQGHVPVGRKLGFTNPATWDQFGLDTPIWAHVYDRSVIRVPEGRGRVSVGGMVAPRIEPEIVVGLNADVPEEELPAEALMERIDWVAIGFEIVDCHYPDWRLTAADAIADFGVHAALVIGPRIELQGLTTEAWLAALRDVQVSLRSGNEVVATGRGADALGNPVRALAHAVGVIGSQPWAPRLSAGEVVTTGTLTPFPRIEAGEVYTVSVAGAPDVELIVELEP